MQDLTIIFILLQNQYAAAPQIRYAQAAPVVQQIQTIAPQIRYAQAAPVSFSVSFIKQFMV